MILFIFIFTFIPNISSAQIILPKYLFRTNTSELILLPNYKRPGTPLGHLQPLLPNYKRPAKETRNFRYVYRSPLVAMPVDLARRLERQLVVFHDDALIHVHGNSSIASFGNMRIRWFLTAYKFIGTPIDYIIGILHLYTYVYMLIPSDICLRLLAATRNPTIHRNPNRLSARAQWLCESNMKTIYLYIYN